MNPQILIDCEKLKYPYTGLWSFLHSLMSELTQKKFLSNGDITALVQKKNVGDLGAKTNYLKAKIWDISSYNPPIKYNLFHQPYQEGRYLAKGSNQKMLLTIHDLNCLYEKGGKHKKRSLEKIKKNIERADAIVTISEFAKKDVLAHFDLGEKPITVIYNGCSTYRGEMPLFPTSYRPKKAFIFSLGTILPKKNFHVLPCLLHGNDFELVIAGKNTAYQTEIMNEAVRWGVADRVKIIGAVNESDKQWYYAHCEAFAFPSIAEGFGLPIVEAMQYGKPLFLSQRTSVPEIGGGDAYYFDPDFDPKKMQNTFLNGLNDFTPQKALLLKQRTALFSWEKAAIEYWGIYHKMLDL